MSYRKGLRDLNCKQEDQFTELSRDVPGDIEVQGFDVVVDVIIAFVVLGELHVEVDISEDSVRRNDVGTGWRQLDPRVEHA